jgi:hypothetical protein
MLTTTTFDLPPTFGPDTILQAAAVWTGGMTPVVDTDYTKQIVLGHWVSGSIDANNVAGYALFLRNALNMSFDDDPSFANGVFDNVVIGDLRAGATATQGIRGRINLGSGANGAGSFTSGYSGLNLNACTDCEFDVHVTGKETGVYAKHGGHKIYAHTVRGVQCFMFSGGTSGNRSLASYLDTQQPVGHAAAYGSTSTITDPYIAPQHQGLPILPVTGIIPAGRFVGSVTITTTNADGTAVPGGSFAMVDAFGTTHAPTAPIATRTDTVNITITSSTFTDASCLTTDVGLPLQHAAFGPNAWVGAISGAGGTVTVSSSPTANIPLAATASATGASVVIGGITLCGVGGNMQGDQGQVLGGYSLLNNTLAGAVDGGSYAFTIGPNVTSCSIIGQQVDAASSSARFLAFITGNVLACDWEDITQLNCITVFPKSADNTAPRAVPVARQRVKAAPVSPVALSGSSSGSPATVLTAIGTSPAVGLSPVGMSFTIAAYDSGTITIIATATFDDSTTGTFTFSTQTSNATVTASASQLANMYKNGHYATQIVITAFSTNGSTAATVTGSVFGENLF